VDKFDVAKASSAAWMSGDGTVHPAQKKTWPIPLCRHCATHVRAANQAISGTSWGMVIGTVVALAGFLMADIWLSPGGVIIHFSSMAYGALKVQYAEELLSRRCCDRKLGVMFGGHSGAKYFIHFRSLSYAHEFRALNANKVL
jgi:hypothetical protein